MFVNEKDAAIYSEDLLTDSDSIRHSKYLWSQETDEGSGTHSKL